MIYHWSSLFLILSSLVSLHAQNVATPANIVCYQEVVASQGSYAQINASLSAWSQKMYQTLGLTGPIELQVGWARVPDRTSFENGCNGPYPNIADLFVHIQTTSSQYDSVSSQLESFIAANRMTSQPNIVCSARSIVTYLPGCGKVGSGGNPPNNGNSSTPTPTPTPAPGNSTTAPTEAPSNNGTNSNSTEAPTTGPSTNSTEAPTRGPSPTNAPSNETTSAPTEAPSNSTDVSSSTGSIGNSSSDSNSTSSSSSSSTADSNLQVAGAGAADQSATGGITFSGASATSVAGTWIVVPCVMGLVTMVQH